MGGNFEMKGEILMDGMDGVCFNEKHCYIKHFKAFRAELS
jgi:hypothetical protein